MSTAAQPPEFRYREATGADLPVLLVQRRKMFIDMGYRDDAVLEEVEAASRRFFEERFVDGRFRAWVAEVPSGEIVAGGGVLVFDHLPSPRDPHPERPLIVNVYTEPAYRRRGIARALIELMVGWCRERGFGSVTLYASPGGKPLYAALGFSPTNEMRMMLR
ncbi:MAG TPA: GNAT family N-acetyltransferase [Bacteroidota bacterium]|nr:GNAT family N-acetyltransferase [Bacteroidota bacterium]